MAGVRVPNIPRFLTVTLPLITIHGNRQRTSSNGLIARDSAPITQDHLRATFMICHPESWDTSDAYRVCSSYSRDEPNLSPNICSIVTSNDAFEYFKEVVHKPVLRLWTEYPTLTWNESNSFAHPPEIFDSSNPENQGAPPPATPSRPRYPMLTWQEDGYVFTRELGTRGHPHPLEFYVNMRYEGADFPRPVAVGRCYRPKTIIAEEWSGRAKYSRLTHDLSKELRG